MCLCGCASGTGQHTVGINPSCWWLWRGREACVHSRVTAQGLYVGCPEQNGLRLSAPGSHYHGHVHWSSHVTAAAPRRFICTPLSCRFIFRRSFPLTHHCSAAWFIRGAWCMHARRQYPIVASPVVIDKRRAGSKLALTPHSCGWLSHCIVQMFLSSVTCGGGFPFQLLLPERATKIWEIFCALILAKICGNACVISSGVLYPFRGRRHCFILHVVLDKQK